ncbi:MmgE/PrpD family protein [Patulibacter defluvii]|uniref:MmgE/PrpD family protein n=1 Tax=Patulibacter defluvii TaxID=3095358 RepID=UPI002A75736C|nr:MmgE/PrpD family protein [Patulibacter sp. DM4]
MSAPPITPDVPRLAHALRWDDLPAATRDHVGLLIADAIAVSVAGRLAPAGRIAAEHAAATYAGGDAVSWWDGRRLSVVGAAWANGVLANVLDLDDGHRLTKGHPGAMVVPALVAVAQARDATLQQLREAVVVAYEVAVRAGIVMHEREPTYHASGAWGAIGVAAGAARLLGASADQTGHALGLAEYHAPIAPIMHSCAHPAMTKDACDVGARLGVEAALLAARGFTAAPSLHVADHPAWDDLGQRWRLREAYLKAYPCCRWTQGAIRAALAARERAGVPSSQVAGVRIRTFAAADGLSHAIPTDTEQAQYNIVWPVAHALAHGDFSVDAVLGPFDDPEALRLAAATEVVVDEALTAEFPARRLTAVTLELRDGRTVAVEPFEARGEPDDPAWAEIVADKVRRFVDPIRRPGPAPAPDLRLGQLDLDALVDVLAPSPAG